MIPTQQKENVLLQIRNLSKSFKNNLVFEKLNFDIKKGEKIALLGVNGCGKTVLSEIILGLKSATSGQIIYKGKKQDFLRNTQVIYQSGEYPRKLLVHHIISLYENLFQLKMEHNKIDKLMKILQIYEFKKSKINKLSFGQRKKLEAALMLVIPTRFLIIDELTAGVDINGRIELFRLFKELYEKNPDKSMIWITHDVEEINLCNRVIMMSKRDKTISFDGSLEAAKHKYKSIKNMINKYIEYEIGGNNEQIL